METWITSSSMEHLARHRLYVCAYLLHRDEVITKLEDVILTIVQDLSQEKPPSIKYNSRNSWKNTRFG